MRSFLVVLLLLLSSSVAEARGRGGSVRVKAHARSDGTWVPPHAPTAPDTSFTNNWSTVGNVNPYTGAPGRKTSRR
jgi:hypothetical protein